MVAGVSGLLVGHTRGAMTWNLKERLFLAWTDVRAAMWFLKLPHFQTKSKYISSTSFVRVAFQNSNPMTQLTKVYCAHTNSSIRFTLNLPLLQLPQQGPSSWFCIQERYDTCPSVSSHFFLIFLTRLYDILWFSVLHVSIQIQGGWIQQLYNCRKWEHSMVCHFSHKWWNI